VATALLDRFAHDGHLFAVGQPGSLMVSIGTILAGVGLIRSRVLPLWIPVLSILAVGGTFLPSWGPVSLITNIPAAVVAVAIGWFAYRRVAAAAQ
jgi:membrane protein implicated in regulation of membrane protease activity